MPVATKVLSAFGPWATGPGGTGLTLAHGQAVDHPPHRGDREARPLARDGRLGVVKLVRAGPARTGALPCAQHLALAAPPERT